MNLFNKLAAQESNFKNSQFLSPVLRSQNVRVRIAGIVMSLRVADPIGFEGWGIFQPINFNEAKLVREPSLAERSAYLRLFPAVRIVVSHRTNRRWYGVPAAAADTRFGLQDLIPISLGRGCEKFDTVIARFDGSRCWFEQRDPRRSARIAKEIREHLRDLVELNDLRVAGCTDVERAVYEEALRHQLENRKDSDEVRIQKALHRGGAKYQSHRDQGESFTVTYEVNGQVHRSTVDKSTLSVQSAGICLDGFDANFDLQSLVGVIAEGHATNQINRV